MQLDIYSLPKIDQDEVNNLNRHIRTNDLEAIIKTLPTGKKSQNKIDTMNSKDFHRTTTHASQIIP